MTNYGRSKTPKLASYGVYAFHCKRCEITFMIESGSMFGSKIHCPVCRSRRFVEKGIPQENYMEIKMPRN